MSRSTYAKEQAAIAYQNIARYCSAHSAAAGTTGANELTGGAYARVLATATPGTVDGSVAVAANINIPAGATVAEIGYWDSAVGGNYVDSNSVTPQTFNTAGVYAYSGTIVAS